jgi:hypothetical protein
LSGCAVEVVDRETTGSARLCSLMGAMSAAILSAICCTGEDGG